VLSPGEISGYIETESDAFAATIRTPNLDRQVPGCPDWTLWWLVGHLGSVQRFWAETVRAGGDIPEDPPGLAVQDADAVASWYRDQSRELLRALQETPWNARAWTWWGEPSTVGAIARHQAQEAAVHRWDAQSAVGRADPIEPALADDAVDEFLDILRRVDRSDGLPGAVRVHATESGGDWTIGPGEPAATVSGSASDLLLFLYGRVRDRAVELDGNHALVDALLAAAQTD
jgi:uncharacterized protein (TIGR03083 family)